MCRIAGIVNWDKFPIDIEELKQMSESMGRRGSDDDGIQVGPGRV